MKKYTCDVCGWEYDPAVGNAEAGIAPGTAWEDVAADFVCPLCGVGKDEFSAVQWTPTQWAIGRFAIGRPTGYGLQARDTKKVRAVRTFFIIGYWLSGIGASKLSGVPDNARGVMGCS